LQKNGQNRGSVNLQVGPGLIGELESIGQAVSFRSGDRVLTEGEPGKGIYILRSGSARVSMNSHDGKVLELRELEAGSFIGLSSSLSCDHCCYSVEATAAAEFIFVPAQTAQEFLRSRPDLCLQVIQLLGQEMSSLCHERSILNSATRPVHIAI
jgi:CRP/FNR family transcriptional regulator